MFSDTFKVLSVKRFTKKIQNGDEIKYDPTTSIMVSFKGQKLPTHVSICKVLCSVEPYVQRVVQCFNCLRYGHVSKQCKSKLRCNRCGENHKSDSCQVFKPIECLFCKGAHVATDHKLCPEYKKQKSIKTMMARENISYRDAKNKQSGSFANVTAEPNTSTHSANFPSLYENRKRKRQTNTASNFNYPEYNDIIAPPVDASGNGVCLHNPNNPIFYDKGKNILLSNKIVSDVLHILNSNINKNVSLELVIKKQIESIFENIKWTI